jgi:hypothetical protein
MSRLTRLILLTVAAPLAGRAAIRAAEHLESKNGPTAGSRSLRQVGRLTSRRRR